MKRCSPAQRGPNRRSEKNSTTSLSAPLAVAASLQRLRSQRVTERLDARSGDSGRETCPSRDRQQGVDAWAACFECPDESGPTCRPAKKPRPRPFQLSWAALRTTVHRLQTHGADSLIVRCPHSTTTMPLTSAQVPGVILARRRPAAAARTTHPRWWRSGPGSPNPIISSIDGRGQDVTPVETDGSRYNRSICPRVPVHCC